MTKEQFKSRMLEIMNDESIEGMIQMFDLFVSSGWTTEQFRSFIVEHGDDQ